MAYCKKCGAYIPDGQTNCLACGYDEEAERRAAAEKREKQYGGFAAQEYEAEKREQDRQRRAEERAQREEERRQREADRRRDYEQRRREQQERDKEWAQQEHERRRREYENHSESDNPEGRPVRNADIEPMKHKAMAIMSYISLFFILPLIFCRDDEFAMYHAKQGIALTVFSVIATALAALPVIGWVFPLAKVYLMIKGIINAAQDKMEPLPYIGKYADR